MNVESARLKESLYYDPDTGIFTNLKSRGAAKKGSVAGCKDSKGHSQIMLGNKRHQAHRLAWLYVHGNFPEKYIDHINEIKTDNRIVNLRLATCQENHQNQSSPQTNNTSGFRGVTWHKQHRKWMAQIMVNGKHKHLGYFDTAEQASEAYVTAKRELHPFWAYNMADAMMAEREKRNDL
jgi:hypothetical protein